MSGLIPQITPPELRVVSSQTARAAALQASQEHESPIAPWSPPQREEAPQEFFIARENRALLEQYHRAMIQAGKGALSPEERRVVDIYWQSAGAEIVQETEGYLDLLLDPSSHPEAMIPYHTLLKTLLLPVLSNQAARRNAELQAQEQEKRLGHYRPLFQAQWNYSLTQYQLQIAEIKNQPEDCTSQIEVLKKKCAEVQDDLDHITERMRESYGDPKATRRAAPQATLFGDAILKLIASKKAPLTRQQVERWRDLF